MIFFSSICGNKTACVDAALLLVHLNHEKERFYNDLIEIEIFMSMFG